MEMDRGVLQTRTVVIAAGTLAAEIDRMVDLDSRWNRKKTFAAIPPNALFVVGLDLNFYWHPVQGSELRRLNPINLWRI